MSDSNSPNIAKGQRSFHFSIGAFLLVIIIIYVLFHVYSSVTKKEVMAYEVSLGSIVEKNFYQGLAIRDELLVTSDKSGYVHYILGNKTRVGAKSIVYGLDLSGDIVSKIESQKNQYRQLGTSELRNITPSVEAFISSFNTTNYSEIYSFQEDISDFLYDVMTSEITQEYRSEIEQAKALQKYIEYGPQKYGFLVYSVDGYEDKQISELTPSDFNFGGLSTKNLRLNTYVEEGDPIYKLVLSDDWQMIVPISQDSISLFTDLDTIKIRFTQDNAYTWASCQLINIDNNYYLELFLDDSMERYADKRFIGVELMLEKTNGLKIPNTAITQKSFFTIPKAFFYPQNGSKDFGVMVKRPDAKNTFETPTIYYSTDDYYYIDNEFIKPGDQLLMENSSKVYNVGNDVDTLIGVYNINKGYAVFKPIETLYQNEKYTIVKQKTSYGLSLYDHIALKANEIEGNEIL